jgi:phenylacetic acid degradation operon negative regulatory protein
MDHVNVQTYQAVLERLLACGPIKAWSLIVTILGDLAAEQGARVPGPVLTQLTDPMGMKPEALRVAIHRLRRDGWITSERDGRVSHYGLTAHGRGLTRSVSERVYGHAPRMPDSWQVLIAPNAEALQGLDYPDMIPISARVALLPDGAGDLPETLFAWRAEPGALPGWVKPILVPDELAAAYARLTSALDAALALGAPDAPLERAVLRLVALHQWRRLVLRHGMATDALMGPDWDGARCRARVTALLAMLARPDPGGLISNPAG